MIVSRLFTVIVTILMITHQAAADDFIEWSESRISLLAWGEGFKITGDNNTVITLEHANRWKYGDAYMFLDIIDNHDNPSNERAWYGEFSPRFSLDKMGIIDLNSEGFVRDLSISTTLERGEGGTENLLIGLGTSLKVPGFAYFNVNLYGRDSGDFGLDWDDAQVTITWKKAFKVGNQDFVVDGFIDWLAGVGDRTANLHIVPQIKWDMGQALGMKSQTLWFGTELDYWSKKFAIPSSDAFDSNQFAASVLIKFHF